MIRRLSPLLLVVGCSHSVHQVGVATAEDIPVDAKVHKIQAEARQEEVAHGLITHHQCYQHTAGRTAYHSATQR